MNIVSFEPGIFIEIDDVFSGTRKVARVTETGQSYDDLDELGATPFPIYEALKPVEVGNILGWGLHLVDSFPQEHAGFKELVDKLIASGADVLTYNRAAYWAFTQHKYDFVAALEAGQAQTATVKKGRKAMDTIIATAGVAP